MFSIYLFIISFFLLYTIITRRLISLILHVQIIISRADIVNQMSRDVSHLTSWICAHMMINTRAVNTITMMLIQSWYEVRQSYISQLTQTSCDVQSFVMTTCTCLTEATAVTSSQVTWSPLIMYSVILIGSFNDIITRRQTFAWIAPTMRQRAHTTPVMALNTVYWNTHYGQARDLIPSPNDQALSNLNTKTAGDLE